MLATSTGIWAGVVEGTLRDPGNLPPAGVIVELEVTDMVTRDTLANLKTSSGRDGAFKFDLAPYTTSNALGLELRTLSPYFLEDNRLMVMGPTEPVVRLAITMQEGARIRAVLADETGLLLGDVDGSVNDARRFTSNVDGLIDIWGVPLADATMRLFKEGYLPLALRLAPEEYDATPPLALVLRRAWPLSGTLTAPNGLTVGEGNVTLEVGRGRASHSYAATMNGDGTFEITGLPRDLPDATVSFWSEFWLPVRRQLMRRELESRTVEISLLWPHRVSGRLLGLHGQPVANGEVRIVGPQGVAFSAACDGEGRWTITPCQPGTTYTLIALPPEDADYTRIGVANRVHFRTAPIVGEEFRELTLAQPITLQAIALDPEGMPLVGEKIRIVDWNGQPFWKENATTDAAGRAEFPNVPEGAFRLGLTLKDGGDGPLLGYATSGQPVVILRLADAEVRLDP